MPGQKWISELKKLPILVLRRATKPEGRDTDDAVMTSNGNSKEL
jgi:hypothetical protein